MPAPLSAPASSGDGSGSAQPREQNARPLKRFMGDEVKSKPGACTDFEVITSNTAKAFAEQKFVNSGPAVPATVEFWLRAFPDMRISAKHGG